MMAALAWKEYREQRLVWFAITGLAVLVIGGLSLLFNPQPSAAPFPNQNLVLLAALAMAGIHGLVCGALLLAGEREARTLTFLDTLPSWRANVWAVKLLAGVVLTLGQAAAIAVLVWMLGFGQILSSAWQWFVIFSGVGLEALAWGMVGGAVCRNVLAAAGLSAVLAAVSWIVCGPVTWPLDDSVLIRRSALAIAALACSALMHCWTDLERLPAVVGVLEKTAKVARWHRWRALAWLCWQQGRITVCVLGIVALGAGLLVPDYNLVVWPVATLIIGIVCGTGVFAGEQAEGSYRFLGSQRLPPGQVWLAKVIFWLGAATAAMGLLVGGAGIRVVISFFGESPPSQDELGRELTFVKRVFGHGEFMDSVGLGTFLTMWLAYGFGFAQFFALLVRKTVVALVLSTVVSAVSVLLWVPSLLRGGQAAWPIFLVPVALVAAGRMAMWAWSSDRVATRRLSGGLVALLFLAGIWQAANLWYRVLEVPDVGEPFDVDAFVAGYPTPEQNRAGRLIQRAADEFKARHQQVLDKLGPPRTPIPKRSPDQDAGRPPEKPTYALFLYSVLEKGWAKNNKELERWLDEMFGGQWVHHLREASTLPLGVIEDPRQMTYTGLVKYVQDCRDMASLLAGRAMQLQAHGHDADALDHLRMILNLSRNMRNRSTSFWHVVGAGVEREALRGLDHWLRKVGPVPRLLRRALKVLDQHEAQSPSFIDNWKAEYLVFLNSFRARSLDALGHSPARVKWYAQVKHGLDVLSWLVPWEKERAQRIIDAVAKNELRIAGMPYWELAPLRKRDFEVEKGGPLDLINSRQWRKLVRDARLLLVLFPVHEANRALDICVLRASRLQVALTLYHAEKGTLAPKLAALVPRYLKELPTDPFNGQSFHYRVSKGERLEWRRPHEDRAAVFRRVPAGQGILWSVGPDLQDDGGTKQGLREDEFERNAQGRDLIFLVPLGARQ